MIYSLKKWKRSSNEDDDYDCQISLSEQEEEAIYDNLLKARLHTCNLNLNKNMTIGVSLVKTLLFWCCQSVYYRHGINLSIKSDQIQLLGPAHLRS